MTRLGISMRGLNQGSFAISTIIYQLAKNIVELASDDIEIYLYFNDPEYECLFNPSTFKRSIKINNRLIWDHFWLPSKLKADKIDIALFMKGTIPFTVPCKSAVIFHDMGYFYKRLRPYKFLETIYMKEMMTRAAKKASKIFTVSDYTKNEVVRILGINPAKIMTTYPDCSPIFKPVTDSGILRAIKTNYGLPEKYIFWPTSLSPSKNLDRILDAFALLRDRIPHHLIITGGRSWKSGHSIRRALSEFPDRIKILGNVPQDHMPALYTMANFTIYPSLLEGFGFPILESFRCGRSVLTSNIASMPEIAGDAGFLVNPYSTEEISAGIYRLANDELLRKELEEKGLIRASSFSWEKSAMSILTELFSTN